MIFTVPSSLAGLPAISIPAGLSKNNKPLGLQLISDKFTEDTKTAFLRRSCIIYFKPNLKIIVKRDHLK